MLRQIANGSVCLQGQLASEYFEVNDFWIRDLTGGGRVGERGIEIKIMIMDCNIIFQFF